MLDLVQVSYLAQCHQPNTGEQPTPGHTTLASTTKANNQRNGGIKEESHQQSYTRSHGNPYRAFTQGDHGVPPTTSNLAKYLARSQLVTTELTTFDDKPENYWAWKASFHNTTSELGLSA